MVNTALETMHRLDVRVVHIQHLSFSSAGSQRKPRMFAAQHYTRSDSGQTPRGQCVRVSFQPKDRRECRHGMTTTVHNDSPRSDLLICLVKDNERSRRGKGNAGAISTLM